MVVLIRRRKRIVEYIGIGKEDLGRDSRNGYDFVLEVMQLCFIHVLPNS